MRIVPMEPTCTNCKFYSLPQHDTDICCAVNPGGVACDCRDYVPVVVADDLLEAALISRKQAEYEAFRRVAQERFGVAMPDLTFDANWLIPQAVNASIKNFLPQVMKSEKAQGYTQEQITQAVIQWAESRIVYHLEAYDLKEGLAYGIWNFLP